LKNLVIGLGNIGERYLHTRHNIGFDLIDQILEEIGDIQKVKGSFKGDLYLSGENLFLKPETYMNLSGISVELVLKEFEVEQILIIHDELDLPFGALKFKKGGGSGGHNGLKSMNDEVQKNAIRIRMGIGKPANCDISDFVLSEFSKDEKEHLKDWIELGKEAISQILSGETWEKVASLKTRKKVDLLN
jgi:PTH1 family peptidyl-tRNA hydrolase